MLCAASAGHSCCQTQRLSHILTSLALCIQHCSTGAAPLHRAAREGRDKLALLLLQAGADPAQCNSQGDSPLQLARRNGHTATAALLQQALTLLSTSSSSAGDTPQHSDHVSDGTDLTPAAAGASPSRTGLLQLCRASAQRSSTLQAHRSVSVSELVAALHTAAKYGDAAAVSKLLLAAEATACTAELLQQCDSLGRTVLHTACLHGQTAVVQQLLKVSTTASDAPDTHGFTPLLLACRGDHSETVAALLQVLPVTAISKRDERVHWYCKQWAHAAGAAAVVQLLAEATTAANADAATAASSTIDDDSTELWPTAVKRAVKLERLMTCSCVADAVPLLYRLAVAGDAVGIMTLAEAIERSAAEQSSTAMAAVPPEVTPSLLASKQHPKLLSASAQLAISSSIASVSSPKRRARTVLLLEHGAVDTAGTAVVRALVNTLCDSGDGSSAVAAAGVKPLHIAANGGHTAAVTSLLALGAAAAARDALRNTAAHYAAHAGSASVLRVLLRSGTPVNATTAALSDCEDNSGSSSVGGSTALHFAAQRNHTAAVELLLAAGAATETRDAAGCTALHRAAAAGATQCVELLLNGGTRVSARDRLGWTSLKHALHEQASVETVALLLCATASSDSSCGIDYADVDYDGSAESELSLLRLAQDVVQRQSTEKPTAKAKTAVQRNTTTAASTVRAVQAKKQQPVAVVAAKQMALAVTAPVRTSVKQKTSLTVNTAAYQPRPPYDDDDDYFMSGSGDSSSDDSDVHNGASQLPLKATASVPAATATAATITAASSSSKGSSRRSSARLRDSISKPTLEMAMLFQKQQQKQRRNSAGESSQLSYSGSSSSSESGDDSSAQQPQQQQQQQQHSRNSNFNRTVFNTANVVLPQQQQQQLRSSSADYDALYNLDEPPVQSSDQFAQAQVQEVEFGEEEDPMAEFMRDSDSSSDADVTADVPAPTATVTGSSAGGVSGSGVTGGRGGRRGTLELINMSATFKRKPAA
jgi:ankyrin repeat protein